MESAALDIAHRSNTNLAAATARVQTHSCSEEVLCANSEMFGKTVDISYFAYCH